MLSGLEEARLRPTVSEANAVRPFENRNLVDPGDANANAHRVAKVGRFVWHDGTILEPGVLNRVAAVPARARRHTV